MMLVFASDNPSDGRRIMSVYMNGTDITQETIAVDESTGIAFMIARHPDGRVVRRSDGKAKIIAKRGHAVVVRLCQLPPLGLTVLA